MDQFERQFENLDVQTEFVEQAMSNTTASSTPAEVGTTTMYTGAVSTAASTAYYHAPTYIRDVRAHSPTQPPTH
jgi:hypothetical protein